MFVPTRIRPWPDDIVIDGMPMGLLAPQDGSELLSERTQPLDAVVPSEYRMTSFPPYAEQTIELRNMNVGMGLSSQVDGTPKQYYYDLFLDGSVAGMVGKGPHFHAQIGAPGQAWRDGVVGRDGTTAGGASIEKEFGGVGHSVFVRNNDTAGGWVLSIDFGEGITATGEPILVSQMARFKNVGSSAKDCVYVALTDGTLHFYDGVAQTWGTVSGFTGTFAPTAIEVINDTIFAMGGAELRSAAADPTLGASWGSPITVGDASCTANWLRALHGQLFIFKSESIYSVSGIGGTIKVNDLFPEYRGRRSPDNGRCGQVGRDALWFCWGDQLHKITTTGDIDGVAERHTVGLGVLMDNTSEVRGIPLGTSWHGSWFGYFLVNSVAGNCYLCKWGTWANPDENDPLHYRFMEVPHGALFKWTAKIGSRVWVSSIFGNETNRRLYVGFADGSVQYCLLPFGSPSPYAMASGCEFTTIPGQRYFPKLDLDFPAITKSWRGASVFGRQITPTTPIRLFWRVDETTEFVELDDQFTFSTQRANFPNNLGSRQIAVYVQLENGTITTTPLLEGLGLHYSLVPDFVLEYTGAIDARHFRARRNGTADRRNPEFVRQHMLRVMQQIGSTPTVMPDGSTKDLNYFRYTEQLPSKWERYGYENVIPFKAIDFRTIIVAGTYGRLEQYTYGFLEQFNYEQLERLL